jgi:proteasome lid subunit RPN8/RPN11
LASDPDITAIRIPLLLWRKLILQLRRRSAGRRESGAFLLGKQCGNSARATTYICYVDLDPLAYQSGAIAFHATGYAALWQYCREKKIQIVADVHTHPGASVRQSSIDERNPMVPVVGHTALIVPHFARAPWWSLRAVGIYEYVGDFKWRARDASEKPRRITLTLW